MPTLSWRYLQQLYNEQTTPIEIISFIIVTTATCMIVAALLYAVVMTLMWVLGLLPKVDFLRVFLPSAKQFREYAGEYFLAIATSVVLSVTLTVKHDTVEYVKTTLADAKLSSSQDCEAFDAAQVFPLHVCPQQLGGVSVLNLLRIAEEDGQSESVKRVIESMYNKQAASLPWKGVTENTILAIAALLMLGYLLWLARVRMQYLKSDPKGKGDFEYMTTVRGLLYLSVCVALLLLAPSMLPNSETIGQSTLASLKAEPFASKADEIPSADRLVQGAFRNQRQTLSKLDANSNGADPAIRAMIAGLRERLDAVEEKQSEDGIGIRRQMLILEDVHKRDIARIEERLRVLGEAQRGNGDSIRGGLRGLSDRLSNSEKALNERVGAVEKRLQTCCPVIK